MYYILDKKGNVKKESDVIKWAKWFEKCDRQIVETNIDGVHISTVFLGIDMSFNKKKPLLFETMIFGGDYDQEQERYYTKKEAIAGHKRMVKMVSKK